MIGKWSEYLDVWPHLAVQHTLEEPERCKCKDMRNQFIYEGTTTRVCVQCVECGTVYEYNQWVAGAHNGGRDKLL